MITPTEKPMTPGQATYEAVCAYNLEHDIDPVVPRKWESLSQSLRDFWDGVAQASIAADPVRKKYEATFAKILEHAPTSEPEDWRGCGNEDDAASSAANREHFRLAEIVRTALAEAEPKKEKCPNCDNGRKWGTLECCPACLGTGETP